MRTSIGGNTKQIFNGRMKFWEGELKLARNNALADQANIVAISKADPIETFAAARMRINAELKRQGKAELSGDKLWKKVLDDIQAKPQIDNIKAELKNLQKARASEKANDRTCFVAGTLVHTKDGLRPIEQIKVGDYVLSKPECGEGELSYKPVTRTFVHEDASDIHLVKFAHAIVKDGERKIIGQDWICVTGNHPFYAKKYGGWYRVEGLGSGIEVEMMDGNNATTYRYSVYQTHQPNVGWASDSEEDQILCGNAGGELIEFGVSGFEVKERTSNSLGLPEGLPMMSATVYNIEVEDNHTYYVGRLGIWAHNKRVLGDEAKRGVLYSLENIPEMSGYAMKPLTRSTRMV